MGIKSIVYRGCDRVKTEEYKDHRLHRATPPDRDTAKGYKYGFLFIFSLTACFTSVLVFITNSYSGDHPPLTIDSSTVERDSSTTFLGVHITENITWTTNTTSLSKKAPRHSPRASLPPHILTTFYRGTIESVLTSCITVWYGSCSAADRKTHQRTVTICAPLPSAEA